MTIKHQRFFLEALETNDIKELRMAICLYIDKDAADVHGELRDAVRIIEQRGIDIWETHKEIEAVKAKSEWNEYYIGLLQSDLMYNFSKKRLNLIIEVANHVYANEKYVQEARLAKKYQNISNPKPTVKVNGSEIQKSNSGTKSSTTTIPASLRKGSSTANKTSQPTPQRKPEQVVGKTYATRSNEMKVEFASKKNSVLPIAIGIGIVGVAIAAYWISNK